MNQADALGIAKFVSACLKCCTVTLQLGCPSQAGLASLLLREPSLCMRPLLFPLVSGDLGPFLHARSLTASGDLLTFFAKLPLKAGSNTHWLASV
eukprot:203269-Pelagomonas_calceolata.AAC.3